MTVRRKLYILMQLFFFGLLAHVNGDECTVLKNPVLSGVDCVAYRQQKPGSLSIKGRGIHSKMYGNFTFYFADDDDAHLFEANPSYYVPQWYMQ